MYFRCSSAFFDPKQKCLFGSPGTDLWVGTCQKEIRWLHLACADQKQHRALVCCVRRSSLCGFGIHALLTRLALVRSTGGWKRAGWEGAENPLIRLPPLAAEFNFDTANKLSRRSRMGISSKTRFHLSE